MCIYVNVYTCNTCAFLSVSYFTANFLTKRQWLYVSTLILWTVPPDKSFHIVTIHKKPHLPFAQIRIFPSPKKKKKEWKKLSRPSVMPYFALFYIGSYTYLYKCVQLFSFNKSKYLLGALQQFHGYWLLLPLNREKMKIQRASIASWKCHCKTEVAETMALELNSSDPNQL